jgi:hypothetical protein
VNILAKHVMVEILQDIVIVVVMDLKIELLPGFIGVVVIATIDIKSGIEIVNAKMDFMII